MSKFAAVLLIFFGLTLVLAFQGHAHASEKREAWLSESAFDGREFRYRYIAYDAQEPVRDEIKVACEYTKLGAGIILRSIEVKVLLEAEFNQPGKQVKRSGRVDVRKAVADCQKVLPNGKNALRSPVSVRLPQISMPSQD